jgi:FMN phosphatase YigB (HAD superfamily)
MKKRAVFDLDGTLLDSYVKNELYENTEQVLTELQSIANLSLVTAGNSAVQWNKLRKHNLIRFFDPIIVVKKKKEKFAALSMFQPGIGYVSASISRADVIVIGDRIEFEIAFGRRFGFTTVRILQGPHRVHRPKHSHEQPDIEIHKLDELISLVRNGRG